VRLSEYQYKLQLLRSLHPLHAVLRLVHIKFIDTNAPISIDVDISKRGCVRQVSHWIALPRPFTDPLVTRINKFPFDYYAVSIQVKISKSRHISSPAHTLAHTLAHPGTHTPGLHPLPAVLGLVPIKFIGIHHPVSIDIDISEGRHITQVPHLITLPRPLTDPLIARINKFLLDYHAISI